MHNRKQTREIVISDINKNEKKILEKNKMKTIEELTAKQSLRSLCYPWAWKSLRCPKWVQEKIRIVAYNPDIK